MKEEFRMLIEQIKTTRQPQKVSARTIVQGFEFERRTPKQRAQIDRFFDDNELNVVPHYNNVWIDSLVEIRPKELASRKVEMDPIRRLRELPTASGIEVAYVDNSQRLEAATTLMMLNNYSQLPVTNKGKRGLLGYISWETIGIAMTNGVDTGLVKDYMSPNVKLLSLETPLLNAIREVYKHDFIVVEDEKHEICGIVTTADISAQYLEQTMPYAMLEEIENHVRDIFHQRVLKEHLQECCQEVGKTVETIDDLSFGDYITLFGSKWERLGLNTIDKSNFLNRLSRVREIRNDVMHFSPDKLSEEETCCLRDTVKFLRIINSKRE